MSILDKNDIKMIVKTSFHVMILLLVINIIIKLFFVRDKQITFIEIILIIWLLDNLFNYKNIDNGSQLKSKASNEKNSSFSKISLKSDGSFLNKRDRRSKSIETKPHKSEQSACNKNNTQNKKENNLSIQNVSIEKKNENVLESEKKDLDQDHQSNNANI